MINMITVLGKPCLWCWQVANFICIFSPDETSTDPFLFSLNYTKFSLNLGSKMYNQRNHILKPLFPPGGGTYWGGAVVGFSVLSPSLFLSLCMLELRGRNGKEIGVLMWTSYLWELKKLSLRPVKVQTIDVSCGCLLLTGDFLVSVFSISDTLGNCPSW